MTKYIYINDETGTIKTHEIKKNKALAKLQRDAVIVSEINNKIFIADCGSKVANILL